MLEITVNNTVVDIDEGTEISFVLENPMFDMDKIKGSYSFPFRVPCTTTNKAIFGYPHRPDSRNYTNNSYDCTIHFNGILFFEGTIEVDGSTNSESYEATIYAGNGTGTSDVTPRTIAVFDNDSNITFNSDLTVTGTITGAVSAPKAWAYLDSNTTVTALTQDTWAQVGNGSVFTQGGETGSVFFDADSMYVTETGTYHISLSFSNAKAAGSAAIIELGFGINNATPTNASKRARNYSSADIGMGSIDFTTTLTANDRVKIYARNVGNDDDITLILGEWAIVKE